MTTDVDWVNDPTPASYSTAANYKRVTVVVRSNRNNAVLTSIVTYVAPPGRAPFGGVNNAIINVNVRTWAWRRTTRSPVRLVNLTTGPSAPLSDTTDSTGLVTFPGADREPDLRPAGLLRPRRVEGRVHHVRRRSLAEHGGASPGRAE